LNFPLILPKESHDQFGAYIHGLSNFVTTSGACYLQMNKNYYKQICALYIELSFQLSKVDELSW